MAISFILNLRKLQVISASNVILSNNQFDYYQYPSTKQHDLCLDLPDGWQCRIKSISRWKGQWSGPGAESALPLSVDGLHTKAPEAKIRHRSSQQSVQLSMEHDLPS